MDKGKIIYMGDFLLPSGNASAKLAMSYTDIFQKLGYKVILVGLSHDSHNYIHTDSQKNINGIDIWEKPFPKTIKEFIKHVHSIDNSLKVISMYKDIKMIICYDYQSIALYRIIRYCKKNNIKIISNTTEWYNSESRNFLFWIFKNLDTFLRMRVFNKKVDGLIVTSSFLKDYYKNKKCIVVPSLSDCPDKIENNSEKFKYPQIIYAGVPFKIGHKIKNKNYMKDRLDKSVDLLYKIHQRGIQFKFDIYGITYEQYIIALPDDKKMLDDMRDKIVFHGYKDSELIYKAIQEADFMLLIRDVNRVTSAGFPTKVSESINCGTPVITTKTSDLDKYIAVGENGFFLEHNDEEFNITLLDKLLTMNDVELKKLKLKCKRCDIFKTNNWVSTFEEFFDKLLTK